MKLSLTLQWRIALAYTALIFVSMGVVSLYLVTYIRNTYIFNLQERLEQEARLVGEATAQYFLAPHEPAQLQEASQRIGSRIGSRVTVIAHDGTVLADTWEDPSAMGNQAESPEAQGALQTGVGRSTRFSTPLGQDLLYTAAAIEINGTVVGVARVAMPTAVVQANVNRIIGTILLAALIVAILSFGLSYYVARRTSRSVRSVTQGAHRLAEGDLDHRVEALASDETQELADAFNKMAASLREMIRDLSLERNKLSAVLETMAGAVIVIDAEGRVLLLNPAAEELLNVKARAAVGGRFMEILRDYELQHLVSQCLTTGHQQHAEVELLYRRRFLSAIATPLIQSGGSSEVLLTLHDLSRIRQVETTRKEFVSNVSHELRTPLASVKAMVETLENGALDEPQTAREFLRRVHKDIDYMSSVVNDLLELSRLESGQAVLETTPLDLRFLVGEVRDQFHGRAEAKHIALTSVLPRELPAVMGERSKLRQVLLNLIDNALKFTPENGKVTLSARALPGLVEVSVSDTGIGIPPEHLPHIFERFYKVDRSRHDGGAGLGLAIVKHIVQAHGGSVKGESKEGEGSTFSFTLPQAQ